MNPVYDRTRKVSLKKTQEEEEEDKKTQEEEEEDQKSQEEEEDS